jgi:hypothetical protein
VPVRGLDREDAPARTVDLPALLQQHDREEGIVLVDAGDRPGKVSIRPLLIRRGQDGGERLDKLGGDAVIEADAPRRRSEGVLIGVDAPESVVLAFGQLAQAHAPVGSAHVHVGVLVVPQVPAEVEQWGEGRVTGPGGGGEMAWGDVDVAIDVGAPIGLVTHRSALMVTVISSAVVSRRSVTSAVSRPVTM